MIDEVFISNSVWKFENSGRGTWVSEVVKGFRNAAIG